MKRSHGKRTGAVLGRGDVGRPFAVWFLVLMGLLSGVKQAQSQSLPGGGGPPNAASRTGETTLRLPARPAFVDGFILSVACRDVDQVGYLSVRVQAQPTAGTFPAQRSLELQLIPEGRSESSLGAFRTAVRMPLVFRQGTRRYEQTFLIPKYSLDRAWQVEVREDERPLPGYQGRLGEFEFLSQGEIRNAREGIMRTGVILAKEVDDPQAAWQRCPDVRTLDIQLNPTTLWRYDITQPLDHSERLASLPNGAVIIDRVFREPELPTDWKGYSTLDFLLVPLPLLERLEAEQPARWEAIRHWVASGGNLWVYAAENRSRLSALFATKEAALGAEAPAFQKAHGAALQATSLWRGLSMAPPDQSAATSSRPTARPPLQRRVTYLDQELDGGLSRAALAERCWLQPYFAGGVVGIVAEDPFPGSPVLWGTAAQWAGARASKFIRLGVDPMYGSVSFWEWVLQNVAQPPVYTFLALLGLFACLVGPVAYWKTTRARRPYWMFWIAPLLALLTTLLMFGYGLIADGLGKQARVRQLTWVDAERGHGVRWSRATYFTGLRQDAGLLFPASTAVYPFPSNRGDWRAKQDGGQRPLHWVTVAADRQRFSADFLPTRQLCQFVTIDPRDDLGGLQITETDPDGNLLELENGFPFALTTVFFRQADGSYRRADELLPNARSATRTIEPMEAVGTMRQWYVDSMPAVPAGFDMGNRRLTSGADLIGDLARRYAWGSEGIRNGIFEHRLQTLLQLGGEIPRGTFVALGRFTPGMLPLEDVELNNSIHFVIGTLP